VYAMELGESCEDGGPGAGLGKRRVSWEGG